MASLRQIAELAGVSAATVSLALRGVPGRVSDTVRQRILAIAQQCHYIPNRLTTTLMTGKSQTIGCIVPSIDSPVFSHTLKGIMNAATEASLQVLVAESSPDFPLALHQLIEQRVAGMIVASGLLTPIPAQSLLALRSHQMPVVDLGHTPPVLPVDSVSGDVAKGAQLVIDYLCGLGHRSIAYTGFPEIYMTEHLAHQIRRRDLRGHFINRNIAPGEIIFQDFVSLRPRATAIVVYAGALNFVTSVHQHGLRIPGDVSVVSLYDFREWHSISFPSITSLDAHSMAIGRAAFELLHQRILEPIDYEHFSPREIVIPPTLVKRQSCAPPA